MEQITEILRKHKLWLAGEEGGEKADLRGVNLREADLREADLIGANLRGADLRGALRIVRIDCGTWSICINPENTSIGCQTHSNDKWLNWSADDDEIKNMARDASDWWRDRGEFIKAAIRYAMDCPVYAKQKESAE